MKKLLVLFALSFSLLSAQDYNYVADDSSYATTDTTSWFPVHPLIRYTAVLHALDSINVSAVLQYRGADADATVFQSYILEADSTNSTTAAGFWKAYVIRDGNTDNIPGAERVRLILTLKTTKNGVTSPTYDFILIEP